MVVVDVFCLVASFETFSSMAGSFLPHTIERLGGQAWKVQAGVLAGSQRELDGPIVRGQEYG